MGAVKEYYMHKKQLGLYLGSISDYKNICAYDETAIKTYKDKKVKDFLLKLIEAMNLGNHDNSDAMSDYFDVGWLAYINVGSWKKPYIYEA